MQTGLYGIIYRATSPSGKCYIGQTTASLRRRRNGHYSDSSRRRCFLISRAIAKYGDAMRWEEIACATDKAGLDFAEQALIVQHGTLAPGGYNLQTGGAAGKHSEQSKAKMAENSRAMWETIPRLVALKRRTERRKAAKERAKQKRKQLAEEKAALADSKRRYALIRKRAARAKYQTTRKYKEAQKAKAKIAKWLSPPRDYPPPRTLKEREERCAYFFAARARHHALIVAEWAAANGYTNAYCTDYLW